MSSSRFQRMLAVPEHEYTQSRNMEQLLKPLETHTSSLFNTYQQQGNINDLHTRVQRQGETLDEIMKMKDKIREDTQQVTPRPFQNRANRLLGYVLDKIDVSEKGELLNNEVKVVEGSNISDLIQHAVRDRRRNHSPEGWEIFREKLRELNVPKSILNYDTLEEISHISQANINSTYFTPSSPLKKSTPKTKGKPKKESSIAKAGKAKALAKRKSIEIKKEPSIIDLYGSTPKGVPGRKAKKVAKQNLLRRY
jgi:hypothetical protein